MDRFLGVEASPGQKACQRVQVGEYSDGSSVTIPVAVISGVAPGRTLYVQAGVHGDEYTGTDIAWRLIQEIDPARLSGTLVVVPIANVPSYLTRSRGFMLEERILQDANRLYPGNPSGLLTERIVAALFQGFVKHSDLTVDIHCPLDGSSMVTFMHVGIDDDSDGWFDLRERSAKAFSAPFLYYRKAGTKIGSSDMTKSIAVQAELAGKAVIMAELGTSRAISREASDQGVQGFLRVMASMGMLQDAPLSDRLVEGRRFSKINLVHANRGGGLRMKVALGADVMPGDELGVIVDAFGATVETIVATTEGFVMRLMTYGAIASGAEVAWIGN